ncbi:MAG: hypothetical protein EOQ32_29460 [Mesorhizobium sp.]|nr:hypothetical protein EJ067_06515 [Mesorhizobium sp. M1D.F.Ca.ET.043.01.1.1]RWA82330.1 MAG: hypothetical protein EOQ32_29460 [Mesorhizobium sp.]
MMPKSVERFSDDIMLYFFDLGTDSDFRSNRPENIRLQAARHTPMERSSQIARGSAAFTECLR